MMNLDFLENKIIRFPLYLVFGGAMFMFFLFMTFPDSRVKEIIAVQVENALENRYDVEIASLGLWRFTGVQLRGVKLTERLDSSQVMVEQTEDGDQPSVEPMSIQVERVSARLAPLASAFHRGLAVNFRVDTGGGPIHGGFRHSGRGQSVEVVIDEVDLRKTTLLSSMLGLPVFGVLNGRIEFDFEPNRPVVRSGFVDLQGKQLTVGPAMIHTDKFPPMTYLDVPQANFGTLSARMEVEKPDEQRANPRLVVRQFTTNGRDLRGELWGDITLSSQLAASQPKLELRLQFDETFVTENSLGPILNMSEFRSGKNKEWYGFVLFGTFGHLNVQGSPTVAQGKAKDES